MMYRINTSILIFAIITIIAILMTFMKRTTT